MPITIPEFVQFQGVLYPLRGLWNAPPLEGDRFVNAEIDWGTSGMLGVGCVQFQLSGNSPVAFSQIVALSVDNSRCNADVDFIFPDSGFVLTVPGFNQGVYPVFTNALMFYVSSPSALLGDITIVQILNSQPPPVAIQPSLQQQHASSVGVPLSNGTTQLVPNTVSGTIVGFTINYSINATAAGGASITLQDGTHALWGTTLLAEVTPPVNSDTINISGLNLQFNSGVSLVVSSSTINSGAISVNLYYSVP